MKDTSPRRSRGRSGPMSLASVIAAALLVAVACTGGSGDNERSEPTAFQPTYKATDCPADVLPSIADFRTCGYVTVPEDRSKPQGRTIRLFLTHVVPPDGDPASDPLLTLGADLGWQPYYDGIAPLTQRVHREVFILDARGVGHSRPSLSCPEVDALRRSAPGVSTGDPRLLPTFLVAVAACHDRLVTEGVDLSAYNLAEMAADVEDVRIALGVARWNLGTSGTWSTVLFEIIRRYPEHLRAVILDSPDVPQVDLFSEAIIGTRYAMRELSAACRSVSNCRRAFPDLERILREDLLELGRTPARIQSAKGEVTILDSTVVRFLRQLLATGAEDFGSVATLPSIIDSLRAESSHEGGIVAGAIEDPGQPVLSLGYAGPGVRPAAFSDGTFYSVLCHDELPFVDRRALRELAGAEPWYADAYVSSPFVDACERWDVGRAARDPHELVTSDTPTLIAVGRFDPFSPLPLVQQTARALAESWVVEIPSYGHRVLHLECPRAIRNGWIDDPTSPPDTSCIAGMNEIEFETK
jgi:pimeloyl-ACP methyl ester carboxylesterase